MSDNLCLVRGYEKNSFAVRVYYPRCGEAERKIQNAQIKEHIVEILKNAEEKNNG